LSTWGCQPLTLNVQVCDLCSIAVQTAEDYREPLEAAGCTLEIRKAPEPLFVRADPVRVGQMVRNFLQNAQRFAGGACVTLECSVDRQRALAVVSVRDTGQGFTPETAARLFELFGQAEQGTGRTHSGMGLGLALTKGLAQLQGGSVAARSEGLGKGATFEFALPLVSAVPAATAPATDPQGLSNRPHVLIVEDHKDTAETLQLLLETHGFPVFLAFDGPTALTMAQMWHPEVVISDIGLPGMTGYEFAECLRRNPLFVRTLLVAVSGYADEEARRRSKDAGFDVHLAKPVSPNELLRLLEQCVPNPHA
jgi:CheY-like chemotaxis protein